MPEPTLSRLGFGPQDKLLIINGDDFGMCHAANTGTIAFLTGCMGATGSASVLMPCPWVLEAMEFWAAHPTLSIGVELCLTCEWEHYRWGPLSPRDKVPTLVDDQGCLWGNADLVRRHAKVEHAEIELRAQIDKALALGLDVTHLHNHMSSLCLRDDLLDLYIRLTREYRLPGRETFRRRDDNWPSLTKLVGFDLYYMGMEDGKEQRLYDILAPLGPGLYELYPHFAIDEPEIRHISARSRWIPDDPDSWKGRISDTTLYTSETVLESIRQMGFTLISWRQIRDGLRKLPIET